VPTSLNSRNYFASSRWRRRLAMRWTRVAWDVVER
jgi:hypothetical protein